MATQRTRMPMPPRKCVTARHMRMPLGRISTFVKTEELRELYGSHDLFIMPSYGEGFPLVVQESLACGTPVVISIDTAHGGPAFPCAIHAAIPIATS